MIDLRKHDFQKIQSKVSIGFVGLGNMGYGIYNNLMKSKFDVIAYDKL